MDPGVVIAAETPMSARTATSCSTEVTSTVSMLAHASRVSPTSMMRRRPTRSETAPKRSMSPPKATEYAPDTHCRDPVEAARSRPIVGSATLRTEVSSISKRNTAERPDSATHASRRRGGDDETVVVATVRTGMGALLR
jgi:hypothetical protein